MAKAAISVTEVTVIETPACFKALAILSGMANLDSSLDKLSKAFQKKK